MKKQVWWADLLLAGVLLAACGGNETGETAGRVQEYIDEGGYRSPVILDLDGFIVDYFGGLRGMPATVVLDRQGEIAFLHVGQLNRSVLDEKVTPLLQYARPQIWLIMIRPGRTFHGDCFCPPGPIISFKQHGA